MFVVGNLMVIQLEFCDIGERPSFQQVFMAGDPQFVLHC